jgi:hypothetical protein
MACASIRSGGPDTTTEMPIWVGIGRHDGVVRRDRSVQLPSHDGKAFYEKQAPAHRPDWVQTVPVASERRE